MEENYQSTEHHRKNSIDICMATLDKTFLAISATIDKTSLALSATLDKKTTTLDETFHAHTANLDENSMQFLPPWTIHPMTFRNPVEDIHAISTTLDIKSHAIFAT